MNRKTDTGKTLNRWPVLVDHYSSGETENRYSKDHPPAALYTVLESVTLGLPEVAPFVCGDGVVAVADALRIKQSNKKRIEKH